MPLSQIIQRVTTRYLTFKSLHVLWQEAYSGRIFFVQIHGRMSIDGPALHPPYKNKLTIRIKEYFACTRGGPDGQNDKGIKNRKFTHFEWLGSY